MENKIKYILIWEYHDCYYHIFETKEQFESIEYRIGEEND